jgi:hypothetical protein
MRLLIVEDNQRLLELLAEFLNRTGYRVDTAASVADFHASVATVQYDLIIVDLGLPDGDAHHTHAPLRQRGAEGQDRSVIWPRARGQWPSRRWYHAPAKCWQMHAQGLSSRPSAASATCCERNMVNRRRKSAHKNSLP